ncbi:primase-helicase family protein [Shimia thalassica]|uniref:primase-helicase family protein n=1 Tax=Shimia thalassica TaxID=1715693 RepID=UPI0026E2DC17|nr:primase-helicase family protein [Shimia thalassica]MDO6483569.1 DUF5906 domain-containing protein [Shimia thalassica]
MTQNMPNDPASKAPCLNLEDAWDCLSAIRNNHVLVSIDPMDLNAKLHGHSVDVTDTDQWKKACDWIKAEQKLERNIYFHANPVIEGHSTKAGKEKLGPCDMAQADLDPDGSGSSFKERRQKLQQRVEALQNGSNPPTVLIDSGNGYNALWRLSKPLGAAEYDLANQAFNLELDVKGTFNADRILKVAGTVAYSNAAKIERGYPKAAQASLVKVTGTVLKSDAFPVPKASTGTAVQSAKTTLSRFGSKIADDELKGKIAELRKKSRKLDEALGGNVPDRSAALVTIANVLKREKFTPEDYASVVMDISIGPAEHVLEQQFPERALQRAWDNSTASPLKPASMDFDPVIDFKPPLPKLTDWIFMTLDDKFFNPKTGEKIGKSAFNLAYAPMTPAVTLPDAKGKTVEHRFAPAKTLISFLSGEIVYSKMYRPDLSDRFFFVDNKRYVNSYLRGSVPIADPNWKNGSSWRLLKAHLENSLGTAQANTVIAWMAHNVQKPGMLIRWNPLIVGIEGDGKSVLEKVLAMAMGTRNVAPLSPEAVKEAFTGWMAGSAIRVLEEIRIHGQSRYDVMNRMKPPTTNDRINIVPKGEAPREVINVTNYLALTNFEDALALSRNDRRWAVFKTRFNDRAEVEAEFSAKYWQELHNAIDAQPEILRGWLLSVDTSIIDRNLPPQTSVHKAAMAAATMPPDQAEVNEALQVGGTGIYKDIVASDCVNDVIHSQTGQKLATSRLNTALKGLGWEAYPKPVKWLGKTRRMYFRKEANAGSFTNDQIRKKLDTTSKLTDLPK